MRGLSLLYLTWKVWVPKTLFAQGAAKPSVITALGHSYFKNTHRFSVINSVSSSARRYSTLTVDKRKRYKTGNSTLKKNVWMENATHRILYTLRVLLPGEMITSKHKNSYLPFNPKIRRSSLKPVVPERNFEGWYPYTNFYKMCVLYVTIVIKLRFRIEKQLKNICNNEAGAYLDVFIRGTWRVVKLFLISNTKRLQLSFNNKNTHIILKIRN